MDILAMANRMVAKGEDVVALCVGQPGAPAPDTALIAARKALETGKLGYTDAAGIEPFRQRVAEHYAAQYGVNISPGRVFATTGSSAGFNLAFLAAFDAGDRVAIATPGYPAYRNILRTLALQPVEIETDETTRWALTAGQIMEAHKRAPLKGVLIASPANPSGTMMTPDALKAIVDICEELGIWLISDEIYHGLTYGDETGIAEETALAYSDQVIVINSFSKYYCMTGWRIGWMILPECLLRPVERIAQSLYISPPELSQIAATAAFDGRAQLEQVKSGYEINRKLMLEALPKLGFKNILPIDGAFYAYGSIENLAEDSMDFAKQMLMQTGVAATPGLDFDPVRGPGFMRFSYAGTKNDVDTAIERLGNWSFIQKRTG
jgi:aspartate/methionine/tyrosine aminotransferase